VKFFLHPLSFDNLATYSTAGGHREVAARVSTSVLLAISAKMPVKSWSGDGGADVNRVTTETIELGDDQDVSIVSLRPSRRARSSLFRSQTKSGPQWRKLQATEFREAENAAHHYFLDNQQMTHTAVGATP
jgi:hypothetical protein